MRMTVVVLCGLMAAAPSAWSAQFAQPQISKQKKEQVLKKRREASRQLGLCVKQVDAKGLKPGSREYYQALGECRRGR